MTIIHTDPIDPITQPISNPLYKFGVLDAFAGGIIANVGIFINIVSDDHELLADVLKTAGGVAIIIGTGCCLTQLIVNRVRRCFREE